jgi:hypothetical protein
MRSSGSSGILQEIKAAGNLVPGCICSHTRRGSNKITHVLAQRAITKQECVVMRHDAPMCIHDMIAVELRSERLAPMIVICVDNSRGVPWFLGPSAKQLKDA